MIVICGSEAQYRSFCEALRQPQLSDHPRFVTNTQRLAHRRELAEVFNALTRQWKMQELLVVLEAAGIPSGPIYRYPEVFADPQVLHRGIAQRVPHPTAGEVTSCANPILFHGRAGTLADRAATIGRAHQRNPARRAGPGRRRHCRAAGATHGMNRFETILCEVQDGIATLTLNRPKALNAISRQMADEMTDALTQLAADPAVRVLVLRGAGDAFCAGGAAARAHAPPSRRAPAWPSARMEGSPPPDDARRRHFPAR